MDLELFEDDHYLHGLITSEKLTLAQISQLRAAWQAEHDEVLRYKESCRQLEIKLEAFSSQLFLKTEQNELEAVKSSLSLLTSSYPGKPFVLLKELSHMLPQLSPNSGTDSFILSCAIKTGDSYQLLSSNSAADEVLSFESSVFDDYLRSKAVFSSSSEAVSESMSALFPKHVCDYLKSGSVSLFRNAVTDESQTAGHNSLDFHRRNDDILVIRSVGNDPEGSSFVNRCTWLIHSNGVSGGNTKSNNNSNSNYGSGEAKENLFGSTAYAERYGYNLVASSGADTPYRSGATQVTHSQQSQPPNSAVRELTSLMFSNRNNSSSNNNNNSAYWMAVLAYSSQLMLTSLIQYFEHKESSVTLLQYQAAEHLSALLFPLTVAEEKRVHVNSHNVNNSHSSGVFGGATTKSDVRAVWAEVPRVMETLVDGRMLRGHGVLVESDDAAEATSQCEVYLTNSSAHNSHRHASAQDIVLISSQQTVTQIDTTESGNNHTSRLVSNSAHTHSTVTDSHINDAIQRALRTGKTATVTYSTNSSESSTTAGYNSYQQKQAKRVPEVSNTTIIAVPFRGTSGGRDSSGAALTCVIVCSVSTNQAHLTAATVTQIDTILSGTVQPLLNRWLVSVKHSVLNLFPLSTSGAIVNRSDETAGSDVVAASVTDGLYSLLADQVVGTAATGLSSYASHNQLVRSLAIKLECDWVVVACTDLSSGNNSNNSGAVTFVNNEGEVLSPSVAAAHLSPTLRELLSSCAGHTLSVADLEQALSLHGPHGAAAQCVVVMDAALKHQLYTISSGSGGDNHHLISFTVSVGADHHARDASIAGRQEQFLAENYRITVIGGRLWRPFLTQSADVLANSLQSCFDSAVQRLSLEECRRMAAAQETDRQLQSEVLQLVTDLDSDLSVTATNTHTAEEGEETVADDENVQVEPRILLHQAVSNFVVDLHDLQEQQRLHNARYHNRLDSAAAEDVESYAGSKIVGVDLVIVSSDSGTAGDRAFLLDAAQNQWVPTVLATRYSNSGPNSRNTTPNHSSNNSRSSSPVRGRTISGDSGHVLGKTVSTSASRSGRKKKAAAVTVAEQQYEEPLVREEWLEIFADSGNDNSESDSGAREKSSSRVLFSTAEGRDNVSDDDGEDEYGTPVQRARHGRRSAHAIAKAGDSSNSDNGVSVKVYVRIQHSVSLVNSDVAGNENETTDLWRPILSKYVALHKESLFVDHNTAGSVATPHTKNGSDTHSHSAVTEDSLIQSIVSHSVRRSLATTPLGAVRMGTNYLHDPTVLNSLYAELPVLSNYILVPVGRVNQQQSGSGSGESFVNLLVTNTNSDNTTLLPTRLTKYLRSVHMRGQHSVFTALPNDTATSMYNYLITLNDASVDSNGCELSCVLQPVQPHTVPTRTGSRRDVQQHNQQHYYQIQQEELLVSCLDTTAPIYLFCGSSGTSNSSNAQEDVVMHYLVMPRKDTLQSPFSVSRLQGNLHSVFSANQLVRSSGLVSILDCAVGIERLVAVSAQDATEMSGAQSLVALHGKPQHSSAVSSKDGDINSISCVESSARILSVCAGVIADVINHHSNDNGNNNNNSSSSVCLGVSTYILPMYDNDSSGRSSGSADDSDILELVRCDLISKHNNTVSAGGQLGAEILYCSSSAQLISKLYHPANTLSSVPVHSHRNHTTSSGNSGGSSVLYVSMSGSEFNTAQLLAESSHHSSATRNNNNSGNSSTNNVVLLRQDVTVLQVFILANMDTAGDRSSSGAAAAPDTAVASVVIFLTTPPVSPYAQHTVHPDSSLLSFGLCSYVHRVVSVVASLVRNNYSTVYHIEQNSNRVNHKHAIVCEFNARLLAAIQDMQRELVVVTGATAPTKEQRGILSNTTAELSLLEQGIAVADHIASLHDTVNVVVSSHFSRLQQYSTSQAEVSLITNNYAFTIEQHNKLVSLYNWLLGALASTTPLITSSESSSGSGSGGSSGRHYLSLALHPDVIDSTIEDVTGSGDINSAMHRQYLSSTALSEVAMHNRLLAETLKLLGTDHQQYQHISSVLLPEILHNQNTTTLSTSSSIGGSDSPVLPEHVCVVWRLDDLGTAGEGSSTPTDHDSTVHIYSAAKLTECLASHETVVISGAELSHLLHYNNSNNNANSGSNSGGAVDNKVNIPLPYGAHIVCVTYKPILARSTGRSSGGNGEGKEVVTAVVQYVTFAVSDSNQNNTVNSSAVTATNTNITTANTAATTTRSVVEQILQCISQHSVDTWQTSGAVSASSDTHLMLSDAGTTGANNALCNTAQYSALRSAMSSILNRHMFGSSVSGKVPHLLQNGSFLKHMSAITSQLAAAMLRSDACLFFPSETESAHGLQPGAVVSSHPYNTLSFSGVVHCSSGSDGRYVRSNSAVSQLNTATYPALFSLLERLAINGKSNGEAAESEGVNCLSLCQGSILSQIIKGNSISASGNKRYILICEIDASYHPLNFNNQSHGGASRATDNLLLLVELPHKPSNATLSIFQTIVSTVRAVVASYHYHFQLQAQHAELVGISREFALTSSNLMHTAKELRLLSIVNKYVEQCCVCLSSGATAAGSSETSRAKASPLTLSAFIRSATSTQRTTATAANNNTSVSSPRISSNASSHLLCEVFQSASRVELVAVNEAVLMVVRESLSSNTSVVSGADNRVYSPSKKNGDGNSSTADSGSSVGGSLFYPSVQSASYYFGTKFLATSGTAAVSNDLNSKMDRLAALCLAVNCVIVCDDSNSDINIDAGASSLFIPVIATRGTVGADLKLENCGLAVHHSLLSPSLLNQHQTTASSNDGYALQVTFSSAAARAEYISVISSLGSASARAESASSPKHNITSSIYPQLLQSLVTGMKSYIASHRSYSERILSGHSDVFTSDVSSITAKVLREVVALCSAAHSDSSSGSKPTVTIQKVSAIVSHLFRDVANCKGSVLSYDAKVHWQNTVNGGSETAGDAASPRPSASIFSEESDSDGDAADFEEQEEMKSPIAGTNRVSKFSTGRERSHDGVIGNRKYHNKWLTAVAMNVGNINNINSIGSANVVGDTMGSADSDPSLQLMLLYSHFKVVPSTLTKEEIGAVLASAHGVFACQEVAGSNPLTSTNIRLLINVSVGDTQQAVLEVVLNCNREVHDHLSSRSSGSGGSVDVTLLDSALLVPRNVLHSLLLPAAPTFALLRHTYSQIIATALLQQQHSSDLNTLDGTIANKKQRITLLGKVLGILTSEGNRVGVLLQAVQDALRFLPHISKSVVSCRDVVTDSVIYEATMVYSADKHSGSGQVNVNSSNVYSASTASTPVTRNPTSSVSFVDAGHPTAHSQFSTPIVTPLDPNNNHAGSNLLISTDYKGLSGNNASGWKVFNQLSSPSVYRNTGLLTPSNKGNGNNAISGDVVEYVFECYEIHGTLTVHIDNSDSANATAATGRNINNNLKTPAISTDANNVNSSISSESHSVLQHITRALARRVFELHRGNKNKRLMAVKQEELQLRNYQLAQKDDKVESLEMSHSRTQQELQLTLSESDKLRHLMGTEVQSLKETLRQKKELTAHLRQSIIEQRRESDKKENALNKQITDLKENLRFLSAEKEKVGKEVKKSMQKERNIETSNTELSYKVADLQRQLTASQTATQTATAELERITAEYHAVSAREAALQQSEDSKLRILLAKVKGLDEELMTLRGTNSFLKKQLEATSVTLQTTQQQHATHVSSLQTKLSERDSAHRNADNNTQNLLSELHNTEQQLYVVSEQLKQEQQVVAEQRNKIALLEQERNKLIRGWKDVKSTII